MMDNWQWPTVGGLTGVLGFLFGHLRYKRQRSSDAVLDALDTTSRVYVGEVIKKWEQAEKQAIINHEMYVSELRRADTLQTIVIGLQKDIGDLQKQVERLTKIVIADHPEFRAVLQRTGFGDLGP